MTKFSINAGEVLQSNMSSEYSLGWEERQRLDNIRTRNIVNAGDLVDEIKKLNVANKLLVDKLSIVEVALNQLESDRVASEHKVLEASERLVVVMEGFAANVARIIDVTGVVGKEDKNEG